nr:NAD(P)/FAD-dependent oxidoreductase [Paracoccus saliphilus]
MPAADARHRTRIVVIGAGFAGLQLVKDLKGAGCDIILVDRRNHHLFQPLLYQVATTVLATSDVAWPIRRIFRRRRDVTTILGDVVDIDRDVNHVVLACGNRLDYDILAVATGARHAYFGKDEWAAAAPGLKTLEDATTIRRKLLLAFERAELCPDLVERQALLTFAVVGGGPTGVEMAGIIADLARRILPREFRRIDTRQSRILLIEAGPRLLPAFGEWASDYASRALTRRGVEVRVDSRVTHLAPTEVHLGDPDQSGERLRLHTVIWAAGVAASDAHRWLRVDADRAGRVRVGPDLTLPGDPAIFVLGDTAAVESEGKPVPGVAPAAKQQGHHAAQVIRARLRGRAAPGPFRYRHDGNLAVIGRNAAVIERGNLHLTGRSAWWVWGVAHIFFLISPRSRLAVTLSWLWSFVSGQNSARLITQGDAGTDDPPADRPLKQPAAGTDWGQPPQRAPRPVQR